MAIEYGIWQVIEQGHYLPMKVEEGFHVAKIESEFDEMDKRLITLNSKAILMIQSVLSQKEYFRI